MASMLIPDQVSLPFSLDEATGDVFMRGHVQSGGLLSSVGGRRHFKYCQLILFSALGTTLAERLTDDLLIEIFSRVPTKSLCRFKCVSYHWLDLIHRQHHRKKLPQTMAGIFYNCDAINRSRLQFTSFMPSRSTLICTSLAFLPNHQEVVLLDNCNGLLLCLWFTSAEGTGSRYVVCNPATAKWVVLPDPKHACKTHNLHLGFDPVVSSHFHVFALVDKKGYEPSWDTYLCGVQVYSSETGSWVHKKNAWNEVVIKQSDTLSATVFLNGYLHFQVFEQHHSFRRCLAAVDTEGETLTQFCVPGGMNNGYIQQSQGYLHYVNLKNDEDSNVYRLLVYVLEDYGSKQWTLKHSVDSSYIFGGRYVHINGVFDWIVIHPHCNLIFLTLGEGIRLRVYDMDHRQVKVIRGTMNGRSPYFPYVPLYSEFPFKKVTRNHTRPYDRGLIFIEKARRCFYS